jgi:hypothetical protein
MTIQQILKHVAILGKGNAADLKFKSHRHRGVESNRHEFFALVQSVRQNCNRGRRSQPTEASALRGMLAADVIEFRKLNCASREGFFSMERLSALGSVFG